MTETGSQLIVERVDSLPGRPSWIFVTGTLSGQPLTVGDTIIIHHDHENCSAIIRTIELHTSPGKTTIALDSEVKSIIEEGTLISR